MGNDSQELFLNRELTVDAGQVPLRIDKFLTCRLENTSRAFLQKAMSDGMIWVNGMAVRASYKVKPGDTVAIYQPYAPREIEVLPEEIPLDIVYEDDALLIVNKPAGMVVHPGHGHFSGTLINAILFHLRDLPLFQEGGLRPGLAHRIDKDTSGLLAIGKTEEAMQQLGQQFLAKSTTRTYHALVWGQMKTPTGTIDAHIGRDPSDRQRMRIFPDGETGKNAITHWKTLEPFPFCTLIECKLETGRMHQIRAHMQYIKHPLFNDARYGGDKILRGIDSAEYRTFAHKAFQACPRQALHAHSLGLKHPTTGAWLDFSIDMPKDMQLLLALWRDYSSKQRE